MEEVREENQVKKKDYNILEIYCYLMCAFVFIGVNFLKFNIIEINMNVARIFMICCFPMLLIYTRLKKNENSNLNNNKFIKIILLFVSIWCIFSLVSFMWSEDISNSLIVNFFMVSGTATIFFLIKVISNNKIIINIFKIIEIAAVINNVYSLIQYFEGIHLYGAFYFNINDLATFLILAIPVQIVMLNNNKNNYIRISRCISLCFSIFMFFLLDSRACILGFATGVLAATIILIIKKFKKDKLKLGLILTTIILLLSIAGSGILIKELKGVKFRPVQDNGKMESNGIRINLIYNGIEFFKQHPIRGIGSGNMEYYIRNNSVYSTRDIYNMHNYWLEILVDYGVIIFSSFILLYFITSKKLIISFIKTEDKEIEKIGFVFIFFITSFIIGSISSSNNITKEWIWLLAGVIFAYINLNIKDCKQEHEDTEGGNYSEIKYSNPGV